MKKELMVFFNAVMFLTRIRVPAFVQHQPEFLQQTPRYYPVTGMIVGTLATLSFLVVNRYISPDLAIVAYMVTSILTTGAFHEDGFADVCDAFGGGWTKEKILTIMKDSRLGTFGVTGLIAVLCTKFLLIRSLPLFSPETVAAGGNPIKGYLFITGVFLGAHGISRLMPLLTLQRFEYVADPDQSKSKPMANRRPGWTNLLIGLLTIIPVFYLTGWLFAWVLLPMVWATFEMSRYFKKWIGGYTGDCLGSIQQITEIIFYLGILLTWKYLV